MCVLCERFSRQPLVGSVSKDDRALYGLSIAPAELIDERAATITRDYISTEGILDYYLHAAGGNVNVSGGGYGEQSIQSIAISTFDQEFFNRIVRRLDSIIDLDFRQVESLSLADVDVFYDANIEMGDSGQTLGLATTNGVNGWELFVNYPEVQNNEAYRRYILIHELGHSLGLEHPFEGGDGDVFNGTLDPWASAFPEETVMAYRNPLSGAWPDFYTDNDLNALIKIWGAEKQWLTGQDDLIIGAGYSESISGLGGNDRIIGGGGPDVLNGNQGNDWLQGAWGHDRLFGGGGDDVIRGGDGHDKLIGGGGNDLLVGGGGDDTLTGNGGSDRFRLTVGNDIVTDFTASDGDLLEVASGIDYSLDLSNGNVRLFSSQASLILLGVFNFDIETQLLLV